MTAALIARALRDGKGLLVWLSIGLVVFAGLTMTFFPSFKDQGEIMMKAMPSFFRKMIGARAPWNSVEGFAYWELTHPICIVLSVTWAVAFGSRAIAGGVERGTLSLVLAAPVSRSRYFWSCAAALAAGELVVLVACLGGFAASFYALGLPPRGGFAGIALTLAQAMLVYGAFGAIVLMVSALASEQGRAVMIGVGLVAISGFLTLFSTVVDPLKPIEGLSLFFYYHPYEALRGLETPSWHYVVPLLVGVSALLAGWRGFVSRDLPI